MRTGPKRHGARKDDFLPVSVWYSGGKARAPMLSELTGKSKAQWKQDLEQIRSLGFNTVRTWVEWAHCEPRKGEYRFENLRLLCELAEKAGLRVFIQLYVDSAPDWVGREFPGAEFEAQSGERVPSQAAPGFCTDHEGVRQAMLQFCAQVAQVATEYPNFYGWDVWSEPHIVNWAVINYVPQVQFCYCPYTLARFREWLKSKYRSLRNLNRAWYRHFEDWQEVAPPRFGTILSYTDFIDWKNFIYDKMAQDLRMRVEAIRRVDRSHVVTSHAAVPSVLTSPLSDWGGYGASDDFLMAEQVDFYGTSLYPKHSLPKNHWKTWLFQMAADFSSCANRRNGGFYVGELQAGYGTRGLVVGDPVTAADLKVWMWSAVARGARGVHLYAYYPMSSGYESGGYGLIHLDGTLTERARQAGQIARVITAHSEEFLRCQPVESQVAILYNPLAHLIGGEQHSGPVGGLRDSLVGYFRMFKEANVPLEFIHRRQLETENLARYKLLLVPYPVMFTRQAASALKRYIAQGGRVLAEARLAWNDERGAAAETIPGMGLSAVFGVREEKVQMCEKTTMAITDVSHPALGKLAVGDTLAGAYFAESLKPLAKRNGPRVLAQFEDGSPALVASRYGKGETLFVGSFIGLANHAAVEVNGFLLLQGLLEWAKVERSLTTTMDGQSDNPVEVCLRKGSELSVLFVLNHSHSPQSLVVDVQMGADGAYRVSDIVSGEVGEQHSARRKLSLAVEVAGRDVRVLQIQKLGQA